MKGNFNEVFEIKAPKNLMDKVFLTVALEKGRLEKRNRIAFLVSSIVSSFAVVGAFVYTVATLKESGFYTYLSLMFSDLGNLSFYWKDMIMALVESLPVYSVLILLSTFFVFVFSLMKYIKNKGGIFAIRYA